MIKKQINITMNTGFARAATMIVSLAHIYESDIFLEYRGESVILNNSIKSIMDTMSLGIKPGTNLYIKAIGNDEELAIQSINDYLVKKRVIND